MVVLAGQKVRASDFRSVRVKSKAAAESVTSSTTLQNDDDLVIPTLEVGKSYSVWAFLAASGAAAGDIKTSWSWAGTATKFSRSCLGPTTGTTDITNTSMRAARHGAATAIPYGLDGSLESLIMEQLTIETVTVAGSLQLQWAQNTSSGTASTLNTTSRILWEEIDVVA